MKTILKTLKYFTITIPALMACIYLVVELGGYVKTTSEERASIKQTFAQAPVLPQNFLDVYEKVYPGALNSTMWGYAFKEGFGAVDFKYPMRDAAVNYGTSPSRGTFWNTAFMAFLIEDYVTPQQCLQFNLAHFDFTHNVLGVEAATLYYFKKPLKDLTDNQVLEILVMCQNPSLYNKFRTSPSAIKRYYRMLTMLKARYDSNN